jgi:hypothetical protein
VIFHNRLDLHALEAFELHAVDYCSIRFRASGSTRQWNNALEGAVTAPPVGSLRVAGAGTVLKTAAGAWTRRNHPLAVGANRYLQSDLPSRYTAVIEPWHRATWCGLPIASFAQRLVGPALLQAASAAASSTSSRREHETLRQLARLVVQMRDGTTAHSEPRGVEVTTGIQSH